MGRSELNGEPIRPRGNPAAPAPRRAGKAGGAWTKREARFALAGVIALVTLAAPSRARAQSAEDKAAAEAAFEDGKRLMTAHAFAEACPKFAESNRRDPGIGTMLGLADCYEKNGQTASAWASFREAAAAAARKSDRREALARDNAARLEPLLSKILVRVPREADVRGLVVKRDGVEIGRALWEDPVPVDPGVHAISATAPGSKEWQTTVDAASGPGVQTVTVPRLEPAPLEPVASTPAAGSAATSAIPLASGDPGRTQHIVGGVAAGAGVIGVAVGAVLGFVAKSKLDQSNADGHCDTTDFCDPIGSSLRKSAESAATGSTVAFIVGGVFVAAGAVVWFTAPRPDAAPRVGLAPGPQGMALVGSW
jgi:hypothetical protein